MKTQPLNRPTFVCRSIAELNADLPDITRFVLAGVEVYVGKVTPHGSSKGYCMFNVERWDVTNKRLYTARMENNGLPASWTAVLSKIVN